MADSKKLNNIKSLFENEKNRIIIILTFLGLFGAIAMGAFMSKKGASQIADVKTDIRTTSDLKTLPGTVDDPELIALQKESNKQNLEKAQDENKSFIPTLTRNDVPVAEPVAEIKPIELKPVETATIKAIPEPNTQQDVVVAVYQAPVEDPRLVGAIGALIQKWQPSEQNVETDFTGQYGKNQKVTTTGVATQQVAETASTDAQITSGKIIKASNILNAVMLTSVNSDEPGPILAEITTGDLKGSRLLGTFSKSNSNQKVILSFSTLSDPNKNITSSISAFAVDPESSRTALASDVDNHYFQRYGILIATSFLSGYSKALIASKTTTSTSILGAQTSNPTSPYDAKEKTTAALGEVGEVLARDAEKNATVQPTVTLNAGTAIGVLVMKDFTY